MSWEPVNQESEQSIQCNGIRAGWKHACGSLVAFKFNVAQVISRCFLARSTKIVFHCYLDMGGEHQPSSRSIDQGFQEG